MNKKTNLVLFSTISSLLLSSCAGGGGGGGNSDPALTDPQVLAQNDLQALTLQDSSQVSSYNASKNNVFSKVFGGTSGYALRSYMDQRLKHYLSQSQFDSLVKTIDSSALKAPDYSTNGEPQPEKPKDFETNASNNGALLFLMGAINKTVIRANWQGSELVFDSPRVGLMVTGPGYKSHVKLRDGKWIEIPSSYRQKTLVHEARHSDCTGGMTKDALDSITNAKTAYEFNNALKKTNCAHLHSACPSYHELSGIPACDDKAWGPYAVDAIFSAARATTTSGIEKAALEAAAVEAAGRVTGVSFSLMLNGYYGEPNMSSSKPEVFTRETW